MTTDVHTTHYREQPGGPQTTRRTVTLRDAAGKEHTHRFEWVDGTTYRPLGEPSEAAIEALAEWHDVAPDDLTLQDGGENGAE